MVEYRIAPDGRAFLMEVNGRFWGSLQLAVDAGVNFPLLLLRLAQGQELPLQGDYQTQRRLRWLLGDVDNLLLQLKGQVQQGSRWRSLKCFANTFFDAQCRQEILRSDDRQPALREASQWLRALL
jgi:predicted ATP-grasp superfamily ATP-dependent carboligase